MPRKPDPYEYRGQPRPPEEVRRVWRDEYGFEQLPLFDDLGNPVAPPVATATERPPPAQRHSRTSVAAAHAIERKADTIRASIYRYLTLKGAEGATDEEGQRDMAITGNTYRPRRVELQELGLVADSKTTRRTLSRREAVVWVAVPIEDEKGGTA